MSSPSGRSVSHPASSFASYDYKIALVKREGTVNHKHFSVRNRFGFAGTIVDKSTLQTCINNLDQSRCQEGPGSNVDNGSSDGIQCPGNGLEISIKDVGMVLVTTSATSGGGWDRGAVGLALHCSPKFRCRYCGRMAIPGGNHRVRDGRHFHFVSQRMKLYESLNFKVK